MHKNSINICPFCGEELTYVPCEGVPHLCMVEIEANKKELIKHTTDGRKYTNDIKETLPWIYSGAYPTVNDPATIKRPYAIGAIVSEKLGCCVVAISFDGPNMAMNIANCDAAGKFIVECCNRTVR